MTFSAFTENESQSNNTFMPGLCHFYSEVKQRKHIRLVNEDQRSFGTFQFRGCACLLYAVHAILAAPTLNE